MRAASMPGLLAQRHRLAEHRLADADDELVDHLRREAGADRAHVRAAAGDVLHERRDALQVRGFAARHHGQRSGFHRGRPAGHRRVHPAAAGGGERARAACARHASTGMVEKSTNELMRPQHRDQLGDGILDRLVGRQVEQHDVGAACRFRDRGEQRALGDDVVAAHLPAERAQALHHRAAHQADADIADREFHRSIR